MKMYFSQTLKYFLKVMFRYEYGQHCLHINKHDTMLCGVVYFYFLLCMNYAYLCT